MFFRTLPRRSVILRSCPPIRQQCLGATLPAITPSLRHISTTPSRPGPELTSALTSTSPSPAVPLEPTPPPIANTPPAIPPIPFHQAPPTDAPLRSLLPLLKLQPEHYITIHINAFPFLVTPGDTITLPFVLKDVNVGDILRLTHASILGSRDYTIKGDPFINPELFELRARVVEVTSEPMRFKIKKKQRNRRKKTVKSKHSYTVLRIGGLVIKDVPEGAQMEKELA